MRVVRVVLFVSLLAVVVAPAALALRFTDDSYNMPVGVVGQPFSKQLNGAGGCGPALPYQYSLIGGKLPPGLSLSASGLISGTPTQAGSWSFWVNLSDQNPPSASWCRPSTSQRQFTIQVNPSGGSISALTIVPNALTPAVTVVNASYNVQLSVSGASPVSWSLQSGSLPPGITLSTQGLLSGQASATGDFTFTVQASNGTNSATRTYSLTVVAPLKISEPAVPTAEATRPFQLGLAASGGKPQYTWSVVSPEALPAGMSLDATTGVISGRPTVAGSFTCNVLVKDSLGLTDTLTLQLTVSPKLALTSHTLHRLRVGHAFHVQLRSEGGVSPTTWRIARGSLPTGIRLNTRTGELSGTPRRATIRRVLVQVTDALHAVSQTTLTFKIRNHP